MFDTYPDLIIDLSCSVAMLQLEQKYLGVNQSWEILHT